MRRRNQARTNIAKSAFRQVQQQARSLMVNLRKEIRTRENELRRLREEESRLKMLIGRGPSAPAVRSARPSSNDGRINWRAVLAQLPEQFRASDIHRVRGLRDKPPSEVFAAITRWIRIGAARRKSRGIYQRV